MDFKLYLGVLKRYKRMVISGVMLAVVLSVLSYGTPGLQGGKPTIIPRGSEVWEGQAEILISQKGFPYGSAVQQVTPGKGTSIPSEPIGDYNYMASLSSVYAALANGNAVQQQVQSEARVPLCSLLVNSTAPCGTVLAAEVADINTGSPLPLLTLTSSAPTAADAAKLATASVSVLEGEIVKQQAAAGTPPDQRVELQAVKSGAPATLAQGYSKSIPILVLFAITAASIALAFIRNSHSVDPVRPTRRHPDDPLGLDGRPAFAGNGRVGEPTHGWGDDPLAPDEVQPAASTIFDADVQAGGGRNLLGLRRGGSATRPPEEDEEASPQPVTAEESAASYGSRAWSDRKQTHFLRSSGFKRPSRD
jgi:hypothetical protein